MLQGSLEQTSTYKRKHLTRLTKILPKVRFSKIRRENSSSRDAESKCNLEVRRRN